MIWRSISNENRIIDIDFVYITVLIVNIIRASYD